MIKTKTSAVTGVTYGLLSALIIVAIVGSLSAAGVGVENVFSTAGNGITANAGNSTSTSTSTPTPTSTPIPTPAPNPIGTPNSALTASQQSQITNAAAEIAAGTASAACLQNMNNPANAASMASNNATCLGPGYGIAPPPLPVAVEAVFYDVSYNGSYSLASEVEANGLVYAMNYNTSGSFSATSATPAVGSNSIVLYEDGTEASSNSTSTLTPQDLVSLCEETNGQPNGWDELTGTYDETQPGTAYVVNGDEVACAGLKPSWNVSATDPLGQGTTW